MGNKSKSQKQFEGLVSAIQFFPTPAQRDSKSAFWLALDENPVVDPNGITLAGLVSLTGQVKLKDWWTIPGFSDWFLNKEEFKMKLESATHMALSVLMEIMQNPDAAAAARVNAAKLVIEASGKNAARTMSKEEVADKMIQNMSQEQLESYISRRMKLLEGESSGT